MQGNQAAQFGYGQSAGSGEGSFADMTLGMFSGAGAGFSSSNGMPPPAQQTGLTNTYGTSNPVYQNGTSTSPDPFDTFLAQIPSQADNPARHMIFAEMIKLKIKGMELQIAEARRKEREAELELARLRAAPLQPTSNSAATAQDQAPAFSYNPFPATSVNPNALNTFQTNRLSTPITSYDVEAMMHDQNGMDNLFSWLPEYNSTPKLGNANPTPSFDPGYFLGEGPPSDQTNPFDTNTSPTVVKRSMSPIEDINSPPAKRNKRTGEKKLVAEHQAACTTCGKVLAKVILRAYRADMPEDVSLDLRCTACDPVESPGEGVASGSIGTVDHRKRVRGAIEAEDEEKKAMKRRTFCDVCQRAVASGRIIAAGKETLLHMAEIICGSCDAKYQRCTDCGGGGGPRIGIGKWRMKQVFLPGRKTCKLSHNRLGDRPREIGVHITPTDFSDQQLKEVLTRTKGLWDEKCMARLAVPEMLEIDVPSDVVNPITDFGDVEDVITRNWPTREAMIRADGVDPGRFKRILGLTWAHAKPRRNVHSVDIEEEYSKPDIEDVDDDMSTVLDNIKRTNVVIPPGSELVGMWGGEWDMQQGSMLVTTLIPFEGQDGEDSTALSVGEMITKVQAMRVTINHERELSARARGKEPDMLPQCEHLWVVSGGTMPLVRERMADLLIRKRSFVPVDEYLTRHPDFQKALVERPFGLHKDLHRPIKSKSGEDEMVHYNPLVLVRWLGKDFNAQQILEIKRQEFGSKAKLKKRVKGK